MNGRLRIGLLTLAISSLSLLVQAAPLDALRARMAILGLQLPAAERILSDASDDADVELERARLALYRGDCDRAVAILERPDLDDTDSQAILLAVSRGCARATAATLIMRDDAQGVVVRFQDDEDRALFPFIVETTVKARRVLARELGTRLPDPVWIDLVRDQFSLSALSGLPESAAQTTGTVAVAKWGRVMMISPRAAHAGYPWQDTLTHELTHLVLSQATHDRAPLWLQEGVAKRQETRWRLATPFDDTPSPHAVAHAGIAKGLGLPLDGLGPSIAMLPSPEHANVAFAEVASFVRYWVDKNGPEALPKLLQKLRDQLPHATASDALQAVSGKTLSHWDTQWRAYLEATAPSLKSDSANDTSLTSGAQLARRNRLGRLLLQRGHAEAAEQQLAIAHRLDADNAGIRCLFADTLRAQGEEVRAAELFESSTQVRHPSGRWWSLHALFEVDAAMPGSRGHAIGIDPLNPAVACHELRGGEMPMAASHRKLCAAARRVPQGAR